MPGGHYLVVSAESKSIMKAVGEIGSRVGWNEAFALDFVKIHVPQTLNNLAARVFFLQPLFQEPVD